MEEKEQNFTREKFIEEEHKRIALLVFEWFRKFSMYYKPIMYYKPMKMRKRRKR